MRNLNDMSKLWSPGTALDKKAEVAERMVPVAANFREPQAFPDGPDYPICCWNVCINAFAPKSPQTLAL